MTETNALLDARCKCGAAIGWHGTIADRPACRQCGHRPPQEELDAAAERMRAMFERITTPAEQQERDGLRRTRLDCGLTLRQASSLLGISSTELSRIESGRGPLAKDIAAKMDAIYGILTEEKNGGDA